MTLSAAFTVEGNANPAPHHVAFGSTVDLELTSTDEATSIVWTIMACSEPTEPIPTITPAGSPSGKTASFVMPADSGDTLGRTFLVRCVVSTQIIGSDGAYEQAIQYAVIGAENSQGELPIVPGEKNYRHGTHGWAPEINRALNNSGGGGGGGGGGWTDDGSIVRLTSSSDSVAVGTAALSGSEKLRVLGNSRFEQVVATSGNPKAFYVSGAAHTALSSGAEIIDVDFALDRTVQRTAGAVTTSRAFVVRAPAYSFSGASVVTDAATFAITGAPSAGTNATLTNSYALWVQSGAVRLAALTAGVVVSSATGVLSTVTGTALQVLRWNSGGTALEFANPGSSLSAPSNPADDGKVAVASAGNLTYTLLSNAHVDASAAISLSKLASIATDRLLGRDTAGTGAIEELTVSGGVEFSGAGGIQRSALTGDITAAAGSNTTAIAAGVIVDADVNASAAIAFTKLATIATDSLLGRDTAGTGALETISLNATLSMTGAGALQRAALTGDVTAAAGSNTTAIAAGVIVDADVNASAGIAISKLGSIATDTLMGRDTAGTGAIEAITVSGGIEFSGAGVLQRSAISGDITIAAGSGTAAITAGAIIDADINAAAAIAITKLANGTATSVIGRSAGTTGAYGDIAASADDHVLRRVGGVLGFGTITTASITGDLPLAQLADIAALSVIGNPTNATAAPDVISAASDLQVLRRNGTAVGFGSIDISSSAVVGSSKLAYANIADLTGLSVFGRSANTSGVMAAITGTDGQVLRVSGTTLGFGTIATAGIADNSITLAKLATQAALTVLANATNAVAVPTAVAAASDGQVFLRSGTTLAFGTVATAGITDAAVTYAKIQNVTGLSVVGRSANTTGVPAAITGTDGQVLRVSGTTLGFGTLALASLTGGSAVGQVLINTTGNVPAWGALDLADSDARTGVLPGANVSPDFVAQNILTTGYIALGADPSDSGRIRLSNNDEITWEANPAGSDAVGISFGTSNGLSIGSTTYPTFVNSNDLTLGNAADTYITVVSTNIITFGAGGAVQLVLNTTTADFQDNAIVTTGNVSVGTTPSTVGHIRIPNGAGASSGIQFRNAANSANVQGLAISSGDTLVLGAAAGNGYTITSSGTHQMVSSGVTQLLVNATLADFQDNNIATTGSLLLGSDPADSGRIRLSNGDRINWEAATPGTDILGLRVDGLNQLILGDESNVCYILAAASHVFTVGGVTKMALSSTELSLGSNSISTTGDLLLGANPADAGRIRLSNGDAINWESNPAGTDIAALTVNSSNVFQVGDTAFGTEVRGSTVTVGDGSVYIEVATLATNREIISLLNGTALTTTEMPANTGDKVIYIAPRTTAPTAAPSTGLVMYANAAGELTTVSSDPGVTGIFNMCLGDGSNGIILKAGGATSDYINLITTAGAAQSVTRFSNGYVNFDDSSIAAGSVVDLRYRGNTYFTMSRSGGVKLSFFGSAAVAQAADPVALTHTPGSAADNTVADVGASFNQTTLNQNFADLVAKYNTLRTILRNYGLAA